MRSIHGEGAEQGSIQAEHAGTVRPLRRDDLVDLACMLLRRGWGERRTLAMLQTASMCMDPPLSLADLERIIDEARRHVSAAPAPEEPHARIPLSMARSEAYRDLPAYAVRVLIAVRLQRPRPDRTVVLSRRTAADYGISPADLSRGKQELQGHGFLAITPRAVPMDGQMADLLTMRDDWMTWMPVAKR